MVFSIILGAIVFGSGFVTLAAAPSLWWVSLMVGAGGSLVLARWYSSASSTSFFVLFVSSLLFISNVYIYALLLNTSQLVWYALASLAVLLRWHALWYQYVFDKHRYPLLSIPSMSLWFMALIVALGCANIWGYQLYFGYSHMFSLISCSILGGLCGYLALLAVKFDLKLYRLPLIILFVLLVELLFVMSLLSFVHVVRALIVASLFVVFVALIRSLARGADRSGKELIRVGVFACCSIAVALFMTVIG